MSIYHRIKELAKQRNVSIRAIEQHFNWSNGTISKWKDGANLEKLTKVANYFDVPVSQLLGEKHTTEKQLTESQKLIAYSIDPDITDKEREEIIKMVQAAMSFRKRI